MLSALVYTCRRLIDLFNDCRYEGATWENENDPVATKALADAAGHMADFERWNIVPDGNAKRIARGEGGTTKLTDLQLKFKDGHELRPYVFDAVCFVYTCRRLIDLSVIAGTSWRAVAGCCTAGSRTMDLF